MALLNDSKEPRATGRTRVALFNSADPRGRKVGGIETYFRDYIFYHPDDMDVLFIGVDEIGDLPLGEITTIEFRGRKISYLPLYFIEDAVNKYTGTVLQSETMTFAKALLKNWRMIRRVLKQGGYSAEVHRVEYTPIIRSMGVPVIPMLHVWGDKDKKQSSVLGKYWWLRDATEFTAALTGDRFYAVNPDLTAMFKKRYPIFRNKFDTLTTWANTTTFHPTPFQDHGTVDVLFAGRMDLFKRPDIMFSVIAEAHRIDSRVRFHYVGDGDPEVFPEFAAIRDITTRHGSQSSADVAELMRRVTMGLLTSDFEGMPRFVLETLSSGRPAVALHLPQLEPVIVDGKSGFLVPRGPDQIAELARGIVETGKLVDAGALDPQAIRAMVEPYSPHTLLGKIWDDHRRLAKKLKPRRAAAA